MNQILELRDKRAKAWDAAKAFLDSHRDEHGTISAEDAQTYDRMEAEVVALGQDIERMERQAAIDREMAMPTSEPIVAKPATPITHDKESRASADYRKNFWDAMRTKQPDRSVMNALQFGTDAEGGVRPARTLLVVA